MEIIEAIENDKNTKVLRSSISKSLIISIYAKYGKGILKRSNILRQVDEFYEELFESKNGKATNTNEMRTEKENNKCEL